MTKGQSKCDRCGKQINYGQLLCRECNIWLEDYCSKRKKSKKLDVKNIKHDF